MAREVNIITSGWRATGTNVQTPQFELIVQFDWVDNAGVARTGTRTITFPNVLAQLGNEYVKEKITEMILERVREVLGVDS